jgi:hypothetical protein
MFQVECVDSSLRIDYFPPGIKFQEERMSRGPLYDENYHPQFSGHETFPLRYGWLKKAFDLVREQGACGDNRSIFQREDAIARFGVGKNMVSSIRHWAVAVNIIEDDSDTGQIVPSELGQLIFGSEAEPGLDPFLENPSTLWLIHWQLCSRPIKTTWYWVFNHFPGTQFDRHQIAEGLEKMANERNWVRGVSPATIKRDVECFVRSYVAHPVTGKYSPEDTIESPLAELGLIKPIGKRDGFRLVSGSKPSLGSGVFLFALTNFWKSSNYKNVNQLPFDVIANAPGSPGRVFVLDENELADRLMNIEDTSEGALSWSETSGIKGIIKSPNKRLRYKTLKYIFMDY